MIDTEVSGVRRGKVVYADVSTLHATVTGGEGLSLRLIKNRELVQSVEIDSSPFEYETEVEAPTSGEDRYRYEVGRGTTAATIASYVWLQPAAALGSSDDGDGCTMVGAHADRGVATPFLIGLALLAVAGRSRRRLR